MSDYDYDYVIVGSGFGGSVSAMRLTEKGYSVAVLEMGKRWSAEDFATSNWNIRKYIWKPALGLYGILQLTVLKDVFFLHGAGVGGGSLVYANTLLEPPSSVWGDPQWIGLDWQKELAPHYAVAKKMLGATPSPFIVETDRLLRKIATDMGRGHTFHHATVGVYFGKPGVAEKDPYFGGDGPERSGCTRCGGCMVGCRHNAKNSLDKNYLYFAERDGAQVFAETRVIDIRPRGAGDGSEGYDVETESSVGLFSKRRTFRTKGVVLSAGSYGSVELLMKCKEKKSLRHISDRLGTYLRTNSEAILGVKARDPNVDHSKGIAITSGVFIDDKTHIEICRYSEGSDAMAPLATILTSGGGRVPRWLRWIGNVLRHPVRFLRSSNPFGWAKRSAIILVMQPLDNHLSYVFRRKWYAPWKRRVDSDLAGSKPAPVYIPIANEIAKRMATEMNGDPQSGLLEVISGKATTAHILGGCPIGASAATGVVDLDARLFGYANFYVVDGLIVPANLGVNPSLTITALAERMMDRLPWKEGTTSRTKRYAIHSPDKVPEGIPLLEAH